MMTLAELLTLTPGDREDTFIGASEAYGVIGIYGGHFLGQALAAGLQTIEASKVTHSFHAYFLKGGNPAFPIEYAVDRVRDGRGFDTRLITARQQGTPVFNMMASFKVDEPSESHQKTMPVVPDIDALIAARGANSFRFPMTMGERVHMELISDHFVPEQFTPGRAPVLQSWMKVGHDGTVDARMAQCMLAFLSDGTLMFNSVLPYGIPFRTHRLTSLDQSVWFHRACDVNDWMLYDQRSTAVADGRGLNEGEVYSRSGDLIMSTAQESMVRKMER